MYNKSDWTSTKGNLNQFTGRSEKTQIRQNNENLLIRSHCVNDLQYSIHRRVCGRNAGENYKADRPHGDRKIWPLVVRDGRIKGTVSRTAHAQLISQKLANLVRRFQVCEQWNKMASTSGGPSTHRHGGRRNNSGRKKVFKSGSCRKSEWEKPRRRIRLEEYIYKAWLQAKYEASKSSSSDSEFAAHLLSLEYRRR